MRHVTFDPGNLDAEPIGESEKEKFRLWLARATEATLHAIEDFERNGTPSEEVQAIWREHKMWLLRNKFDNKCAYCEKSMSDIPREAEHWRPKRRMSGPKEKVGNHPGYFWLAYNWRNLFPACSMCNSYRGKKNQFPVAKGYVFRLKLADADLSELICRSEAIPSIADADRWYPGAPDLDALEEPLLLNPYIDEDPTVDLEFRPNGIIRPLTKKGELSVKVFDLNREDLRTARAQAELQTENVVGMLFQFGADVGLSLEDSLAKAEAEARSYVTGQAPYSAARLAELDRSIAQRKERLG